jgi:hypothetical protein
MSRASTTIRGMAGRVTNEVCGGKIKVVVEVPEDIGKHGYAPDVGFTLNADKLKALGGRRSMGLRRCCRHMLMDWGSDKHPDEGLAARERGKAKKR